MGNRSTKTEPLQDSEIASKHGTIGKEGDMPDPFPSVRKKKDILRKVNFRTIDEKTCKVPPTLLFGSFWDLVEHLVIATNFEELDDLFRVRAIFRYMTLYNVFNIESDILPPPGSPLEYLLKIQWEFGDHAHMFWALCSMANIPCVIINGITKHGLYELGEKIDREKLQSRWNAVFINGEWRLLDVFWATSYSEDHERYDKITVDDDGNIKHETNFDGQSNNHLLDEYYFLTDPEELIYTHLPDDPSWQLLDSTLTLEQFQRQPYLRERFFELEMKIPANQKSRKCFFRSKGKPIVVSFDLPEKRCKNYQFKYDLMQTRFDHDQDKEVSIVLDRYVMMEKIKSTLKFTLLLPLQGVFRFDVYGFDTKLQDEPKLVCSYGILGTVTTKCEPFPTQPGHGWGVNPDYAHLGIEPVRPTDAYIMTETGFVEVLLKTSGDAKLSHVLKSATAEDIPLSRHAIGRFQNGEYSINIRLPKDGNYSLNIFTPVNGESVSILSYLIMCNSEKVQNQPFPSVLGTQLGIKVGAETLGIRLADGLSDLMVAWNGELQLDFSVPENVTLCYELNANDSVAKNKMKGSETRNGATSQYNVDVPVKGIYTINVFGYETDFPGKMSEVFSGFIHSTGKSEIYEELKPKPDKNMSKKKQESKDTNQGKGNKTSKKDLGEFDEIITTSVSNVTIPIPKSSGSLFTTLRRCGTTEEEENNDATVSVHNDTMEVRMRKEADYLLSIFAKHPNDVIQSIGRYTICYTKDASNKKSNLKEGKENIEGNDEDADLPFISSGGFITYREEDFKGKGVRPPLQNTYPEQANSKLNQANKTKSKQKTSMKMPRASENSEESPRRQPTMKELDSLVKSLHSQYSVQLPSKPIGLDAYFDAKDTEKAREDLSFACRHREPTMLEEAIDRAKEANESTQKLSTQIVVASRLLMRLSKIDQSSYRLQAVDNKSLAEVKQYQTPPYGVHHSVAATFLLLGDDIESLKTWSKCQALMCQMGKRYIFRRMSKLNPKDVDDNTVKAAKNILKPFSRVQIRDVSKGAACLYAWVKGVIREHGGTGSSEELQSRPTTQMRPRSSSRPAYKKTHDRALVINM